MTNPNLIKARNHITEAVRQRGVFQMRHYTCRNSSGTPEVHNDTLRTAVEQLNTERAIHIISRRPFGKIFEDGTKVSGVNVVAVPIISEKGHAN